MNKLSMSTGNPTGNPFDIELAQETQVSSLPIGNDENASLNLRRKATRIPPRPRRHGQRLSRRRLLPGACHRWAVPHRRQSSSDYMNPTKRNARGLPRRARPAHRPQRSRRDNSSESANATDVLFGVFDGPRSRHRGLCLTRAALQRPTLPWVEQTAGSAARGPTEARLPPPGRPSTCGAHCTAYLLTDI